MARMNYLGLGDAKAAFEALRPADQALMRMMSMVKPGGPDYLVLEAVRKALHTAAYHFTREPYFFGGRPPSS